MDSRFVFVFGLLGAFSLALAQSSTGVRSANGASIQEAIRVLHNELVRAQVNNDVAALDRILADDHIFTNPLGGVQTTAERLAEVKSGNRKLDALDIRDIRVRVFGDTAVVTSRATLEGRRNGQEISGEFRGIDVYVRRNGQWQVVAAQATRVAQP